MFTVDLDTPDAREILEEIGWGTQMQAHIGYVADVIAQAFPEVPHDRYILERAFMSEEVHLDVNLSDPFCLTLIFTREKTVAFLREPGDLNLDPEGYGRGSKFRCILTNHTGSDFVGWVSWVRSEIGNSDGYGRDTTRRGI